MHNVIHIDYMLKFLECIKISILVLFMYGVNGMLVVSL